MNKIKKHASWTENYSLWKHKKCMIFVLSRMNRPIQNISSSLNHGTDAGAGLGPNRVDWLSGMGFAFLLTTNGHLNLIAKKYKWIPFEAFGQTNQFITMQSERNHPEKFLPGRLRKIAVFRDICTYANEMRLLCASELFIFFPRSFSTLEINAKRASF